MAAQAAISDSSDLSDCCRIQQMRRDGARTGSRVDGRLRGHDDY
jgi:hypothetical protein